MFKFLINKVSTNSLKTPSPPFLDRGNVENCLIYMGAFAGTPQKPTFCKTSMSLMSSPIYAMSFSCICSYAANSLTTMNLLLIP